MTIIRAMKLYAMALGLGALASLPALAWRAPLQFDASLEFGRLPANDEALLRWFAQHQNVSDFRLHRSDTGSGLSIGYVRQGMTAARLYPPWSSLGYGRLQRADLSQGISYSRIWRDPWTLLILLGSCQLGLLLVATRVRRRFQLQQQTLTPWIHSAKGDLAWGTLAGILMIAVGFGHDSMLRALEIEDRTAAGPWGAISELPLAAFVFLLIIASTMVPLCEELFFRGALFESFRGGGSPRTGILVTSLLFSFSHFDFVNWFALFLFGVILSAVYWRTGSLLSCIFAHGLNNSLALTILRLS